MNSLLEKELVNKNINCKDVFAIALIGSRLYGTNKDSSDYDYLVITKNDNGMTINHPIVNATIYSKKSFQEGLDTNKMVFLEAFCSNETIRESFKFQLNKSKLLNSTKSNIEETLVKVFKNKKNNYSIASKQLFHAIRTEIFKEQLLENGTIYDFSAANHILAEIYSSYDNYHFFIKKYLKSYNSNIII